MRQKHLHDEEDAFDDCNVTREEVHDRGSREAAPPNAPDFSGKRKCEVEPEKC